MTTKRSVTIAGHRTSISLEQPFWKALQDIADKRGASLAALIGEIDNDRARGTRPVNLSSALRVYVLNAVQSKTSPN
jgi:predicted DNA-binding ribbon-helix-helix protein